MADASITQLRKGIIEICVMAQLHAEEAYGYELLQRLRSQGGLAIGESTLYPLLARLQQDDCIAVRVVDSKSGPPRRYYRLTLHGRERFDEMILHWQALRDAVDQAVRIARRKVSP